MNRALVALALASCGSKSAARDRVGATAEPIVVTVGAPGSSAADVETGVVTVLESAVADVPGVEHLRSESRDGSARISIELAASADPTAATAAVKNRIAAALPSLPSSITAPVVRIGWRADAAVLRYTVSGPFAMSFVREIAAETLADPIAAMSGVAGVDVCGGADPAVMIYADPAKLAAVNVTVTELATAIKEAHETSIPDLTELRSVAIARRGSAMVRLTDVAIVSDSGAPRGCYAVDEHSDVAIEGVVYAQSGVDPASVRTGALAAIEKVRATLPAGMVLDVLPEDKPAALLGLTSDDVAPAARVEQLRRARDALLAAGAQHVVLAEGVRDPMTGLAETDIEIRMWPASVEPAALARLAQLPGLVVARAGAQIIGIRGPDLGAMRDTAEVLSQRLIAAGVAALGRVGDGGVPQLELQIDRAAASGLNVPVQAIIETFDAAIDGVDLGQLVIAGKRETVTLKASEATDVAASQLERLRGLMVRDAAGAVVPLSQVASFFDGLKPPTLNRVDRQRWVGLRFAGDVDAARKVIAAFKALRGYRIEIE